MTVLLATPARSALSETEHGPGRAKLFHGFAPAFGQCSIAHQLRRAMPLGRSRSTLRPSPKRLPESGLRGSVLAHC